MSQVCFRFDEFELDTGSCELLRSGRHIRLERIPMQLLILLLENQGKLVSRETILEKLWGGNVFVEAEHNINTAVNKLRATLRDDSRNPRFIRTIVGQGYCFIAKVSVLEPAQTASGIISSRASDSRESPDALASMANEEPPASFSTGDEPLFSAGSSETTEVDTSVVSAKKSLASKIFLLIALIGPVAVLSIAAAIYLLHRKEKVAQTTSDTVALHSVAVLPFRNLAQTSDNDYLVDGMTDQLTTNLARSTPLRVISQRSAMQYKGIQKPIQEIASALHVDAIVEGSYLHTGSQVRITAQLIDARNDQHLWAQTYDESDKDLLSMQDQVTNDIAQQVAIALGAGFTRSKLRIVNPRAREAYLRGRYFWNERTPTSIANSIKYYTEAIREAPSYADAYAALAEAYVLRASYSDPNPSDSLWKAQYAAERALELDSSLGGAHTALGGVRVERDWDWEEAEKEYRRALLLSPADPTAHHWYSLHLSRMGRNKEAEVEIQRALALDPLSLIINTDAAETSYWARNFPKALTRIEDTLALNPNFAEAHLTKGKILEQLHRYQEANGEYEIGKKLFGGASYTDVFRAHALALGGERADALKIVKELELAWPRNQVSTADFSMVYCALGDADAAMKWFDLAYQKHERGLSMIAIDPVYDGCRSDPRFIDLQRQLRLIPRKSPDAK